jgi:hypothetical protein
MNKVTRETAGLKIDSLRFPNLRKEIMKIKKNKHGLRNMWMPSNISTNTYGKSQEQKEKDRKYLKK